MLIKKGNTRIVWLLPLFGIAIKFPRFYLKITYLYLIRYVFPSLKYDGWKKTFLTHVGVDPDLLGSVFGNLFGGIYHNWSEFLFFLRTRHGFCQPTYFSLFGLVNIQKLGEQMDLGWVYEKEWWWNRVYHRFLVPILEKSKYSDGHHFFNQNNFTFYKGKLFLLDYGSRVTRKILMKQREELEVLELPLPQNDAPKPVFC